MTHKRRNLNKSITCPTLIKKTRNLVIDQPSTSVSSSTAITSEETAQGLRKTNHGVIFQLKLLMLFLIRGIEAGYMFQLGTEMEEIGGKFDDLIFKYEISDNTPAGKHNRYRYLQAKHKQNESFQITTAQLINEKEGDFSLLKYFRSYCDIRSRGDDIEDCIICTNIGFSKENLKKRGIELISFNAQDKMFAFGNHLSNHTKIKIQSNHKLYAILQTIKFHDTATNTQRNATHKEIEDFFEKLVFVTNTPNEVELGKILTDEVGKYYKLKEADFQSDFILRNMLDWFKKKESKFMTSNEGIEIFRKGKEKMKSLRITSVSIHYQRQLKQVLQLNCEAIHEMAHKLKTFLTSSKKIEHIWTRLPKLTAVKVIEALKELRQNISHRTTAAVVPEETYFQRKDSYLMTSFGELKKDHEKFKALYKADLTHNLLVVVCEDDALMEKDFNFEKLVKNPNKKVIIISRGDAVAEIKDDFKFTDLSAKFKKILLSKEILFQGNSCTVESLIKRSDQTVDDLLESDIPGEVINSDVIEELIKKDRLEIASFRSTRFEKSLYIKRQLTSVFPFDNHFWNEVATGLGFSIELLQSKCSVNSKGEIQWSANSDSEKTKIWEKINNALEKRKFPAHLPSQTVEEDDLLKNKIHPNKKPDVVIVSGVAGSGKSSILSHYYEMIKEKKPDHWVIIISLTDHSEAFLKLKSTVVNKSSVENFLLNLSIVDESPFAGSLLRRRLKTGDRMVVMLDGFDESHHQEIVIEMIKVFKEMALDGLFVTTRSHMASQIQFELSQLSYSLNNFSKQDQIKHLTSIWKLVFDSSVEKDLCHIAESLVDRVSETLKDEERAFIGIPLQCRILADCFQSEIQMSFQQDNHFGSFLKTIERLNLSLASLYRLLMKRKKKIYKQEKKAQTCDSDLASSHAKQSIDNLESFLRKLAIKTIVSFEDHVDALLGKKKSMKPKDKLAKKNKKMMDHCARFGLLDRNIDGQVRFLHRTYAEYMMAEYLYTGFLLDDEKRNHLLDSESARKLIIMNILVKNQYDGVQIFLDSMLKEIVDDNTKWRNGVSQRELPDGLHKLAKVFFTRVVHLKMSDNPLKLSVVNKKEKIFKFLCDCLDATFDKPEVLRAVRSSFPNSYSLAHFCHLNSEVFQRYIDYFDDVPIPHIAIPSSKEKNHVHTVMKGLFGDYGDEFPPCDLKNSYWDEEERQKIMYRFLQFIDKHRQIFNEIILLRHNYIIVGIMLAMFIFNKKYDSHLKLFLNLLSQSHLYSDDFDYANFMENIFLSVRRKHRKSDQLKKMLAVLNEVNAGRYDFMNKICVQILKIEPKAFKIIYQPCQLLEETTEGLRTDLHLLLEQDSFRIACFHQAVITNQTDFVHKLLTTDWNQNPEKNNFVTEQVNFHDFTPFYVAATWGNEKICCNLLAFLKKHLPVNTFKKGLIDINGFVYRPLSYAILSENTEMCKVIIKAVKQTLGQDDLIALLKSKIQARLYSNNPNWAYNWIDTSMFVIGCKYKMFRMIADIVLEKDNVTGKTSLYEDLNDLILDKRADQRTVFKHFDVTTLQGIMSIKGSDNWTKQLLESDFWNGFPSLIDFCLKFFNQVQLLQFVTTITSKDDTNGSYWGLLCSAVSIGNYRPVGIGDLRIFKFLELILNRLGETVLMKLLLHDEGNRFVESYILSQELVKILSNKLSEKCQEEVRQHWKKNVPLMIQEYFFCPNSENYPEILKTENWIGMLQLYLDYASDDQQKKFVNFITDVRKAWFYDKGSIWSYVFLDIAESNKILKRVLEKPLTFGQDAVKTLLYHENKKIPLILSVALEEDFNARLVELPNHIREEIQDYIAKHAHQFIEECLRDPCSTNQGLYNHHLNLNKFTRALNYCNAAQLQDFAKKFTSLHGDEADPKKCSVWSELFGGPFPTSKGIQTMHKFLKCVSEKLGQNEVLRLVLHDDGKIICSKTLEDQEDLIEAMLSYLDAKNRKMIQRKIDAYLTGYLAEKFKETGGLLYE